VGPVAVRGSLLECTNQAKTSSMDTATGAVAFCVFLSYNKVNGYEQELTRTHCPCVLSAGSLAPAVRPRHSSSARRLTRSSQHPLQQQRRSPAPAPCRVATPVEVLTTTPEAPPTAAPGSEPAQPPQFSWTKAWYPIAAVEHLDPNAPNKVTLLGKDYVLWADAKGDWKVMEDRCPHRLATLSDGIVHREAGSIVCAYHGWSFAVGGSGGSWGCPGGWAAAAGAGSAGVRAERQQRSSGCVAQCRATHAASKLAWQQQGSTLVCGKHSRSKGGAQQCASLPVSQTTCSLQ
jgi:nitrite reductase/ring-hydroxylating ferredoxin subunit